MKREQQRRTKIVEELHALGVREDDSLLVHGDVGGQQRTLTWAEALIVAVSGGTILCPGFGFNRYAAPHTFEPTQTGRFSPLWQVIWGFRMSAEKRQVTGQHPLFSFIALGPNASFLLDKTPFHYPLGENSPLARLYQLNGGILLLGVGQTANPALHLAEVWADVPYARRSAEVIDEKGEPVRMEGNPECSRGFGKIKSVLRQARILRSGVVDNVPIQFMRIQYAVSMAIEMLRGNPESLLCDNADCPSCTQARKLTATQTPGPSRGLE